jgi:hypothetical protein
MLAPRPLASPAPLFGCVFVRLPLAFESNPEEVLSFHERESARGIELPAFPRLA